jgi:transposase
VLIFMESVPPVLPSYEVLAGLVAELRSEVAGLRAELAAQAGRIVELEAENAELRRRAGLNSRNSSKPPSSDGLGKPAPKSLRKPSGRGPGKPKGAAGGTLRQTAVPDETLVHVPPVCEGCGDSLAEAVVVGEQARQVIDIPPVQPKVTEHVLQTRRCGGCGETTVADAPAGVNAPVQYGPQVKGAAVYLSARQHVPYQRCAELLSDLLGTPVTAPALHLWNRAAADRLAGFTRQICEQIATAPVAGFDESGGRIDGKIRWIHTATTNTATAYLVHDKRGTEAFNTMGILPVFTGIAVHDGWKPYKTYPQATHALCNAHHLRELNAALESDPDGQTWADDMAGLLTEIWEARKQLAVASGAKAFPPSVLADYLGRYENIITAGHEANPPPPTGTRKRTRPANLLHRLDTEREQVLRFATDWQVPFDNNQSEQAIRMAKVQLNISHCWRTIEGAERFLTLRGYLETAKKNGQDLLDTLARLFDGRGAWTPTPN